MKKILIVSQNFYPEQFRINDIAVSLVDMGYDVTVLTGLPNYPYGKIYDGFEHRKNRREEYKGVKIIRCYERERKKGGAINLFLNYYSFVCSSKRMISKLDKDFDCVIVNQTSPVMQAEAGIKYAKKYGVPLYIYCLDLWPASLVAGGVGSNNPVYKLYHGISKRIYSKADKIFVTSKMFKEYLAAEFGYPQDRIIYLPQYAEDMFGNIKAKSKKSKQINVMFAGNVGKMQAMDTIIDAAKILKDKNVLFHIVGDGSEYQNCVDSAKGLNNIKFYGQRPLEEMPQLYSTADAMLVSLRKDELISRTLPGKVQTYMAAGKPIIASGENELKNIIEEAHCGYVAPPQDGQALAKCIEEFCDNPSKDKLAQNARKYYLNHFTKDLFFKKLLKEIKGE